MRPIDYILTGGSVLLALAIGSLSFRDYWRTRAAQEAIIRIEAKLDAATPTILVPK